MEPARVLVMLLSANLLHSTQCVPAGRVHGLDYEGGVRRVRRDVLPYKDRVMSLPVVEDNLRGPGLEWDLEQALQRLVERDQRWEQQEEQQRVAYLSAVLRLLANAERAGLVNPRLYLPDYDETSPRLSISQPEDPWWRLGEPQLAKALLQRLDPDYTEALLSKLQQTQGTGPRENDQERLRRLIGHILSRMGPSNAVISSGHRMRRDLSDTAPSPIATTHRRSRRSLEDRTPSDDPPLLRVKRLEEDELESHPDQGLQPIKRLNIEKDHLSHRRNRRAIVNYNPQILLRQVLELINE